MDYGDDRPPPALSSVVVYEVLWAVCALVLHALVPGGVTLVFR